MTSDCSLSCRGISKRFGKRLLFEDLSFDLAPRERLALLGASGSGKSTLLHCLSGVTPVDSGEIVLDGNSLTDITPDALAACRRSRMGTVFQFFHLLPTLTAFENIELPLQLINLSPSARIERVTSLLERMGISHRAHAFPSELSGGEMQRVAIARALAHRPSIVFADEPTGNLDRKSGETVLQLLQEVTAEEGAALLMVTHSDEAAAICQRHLTLIDGVLVNA